MKNKLFLLLAVASLNASLNAWNYLPEWLGGTKKEEAKPAEVKPEAAPAEVKPAETVPAEVPAEAVK